MSGIVSSLPLLSGAISGVMVSGPRAGESARRGSVSHLHGPIRA